MRAKVYEGVADLMDALDKDGARYAHEYALYMVGERKRGPQKPRSLPPELAKLMRDVGTDVAMVEGPKVRVR